MVDGCKERWKGNEPRRGGWSGVCRRLWMVVVARESGGLSVYVGDDDGGVEDGDG